MKASRLFYEIAPTNVLLQRTPSSLGAVIAAVALVALTGCPREAARGSTATFDRTAQALLSSELLSINGTYGLGCVDRSGGWSIEVADGAVLDYPSLSVALKNTGCALTLTEQRTTDGLVEATTPMLLTASYAATATAFGDPVAFYANAKLSSTSFDGDFVVTLRYSDDPHTTALGSTALRAPSVTATTPADGAIDRSINTRPTARFSTAMDDATISALTFLLTQDSMPVDGTVTFDELTDTATFIPDELLELGLLYEATLTTSIEDASGVPLPVPYVFSFTIADASEPRIDLGSASGFALLAGSTITSTGLTTVTGDLGVSPGTAVTGFGPGVLNGTLHSNDPQAVQAIMDLGIAYDDAVARSLSPILKVGDLGGQTLLPGLYKSLTSLEVTAGDLILDADDDSAAIFVFQMATTFTMTSGFRILLINGADADNIYWQVGTSATIGTYCVLEGTLMAHQSVTLATSAAVNGRVLARFAAVTMDTNAVVLP